MVKHPLVAKIWGPLVGPMVAVVSFVCSVNIIFLLAAGALVWRFLRTGGPAMPRMMRSDHPGEGR